MITITMTGLIKALTELSSLNSTREKSKKRKLREKIKNNKQD